METLDNNNETQYLVKYTKIKYFWIGFGTAFGILLIVGTLLS